MKTLTTLLAITLMLTMSNASAQKSWKRITLNDYAVILTQGIAGAADGLNQSIEHHRFGVGKPFWDQHTSWKNKYMDFDGGDYRAKYFLSKSLLAFTTDGYHLTRFINRTATLATICIVAGEYKSYPKKDRWKVMAKKLVLSIVANRVMFNLVYQ